MARKLRVEYPGAIYHVMNRGDRREAIFKDDKDRERFLETLGETCARPVWKTATGKLLRGPAGVVERPRTRFATSQES